MTDTAATPPSLEGRRTAVVYTAGLLLLIFLQTALRALSVSEGAYFLSHDEVSRLIYARDFAETGSIASYDHTWPPGQFAVVGTVGRWLGGAHGTAMGLVNTAACLLAVLAGYTAVFAALRWEGLAHWAAGGTALGAGVLALSAPWQSFFSVMGFAEPMAWGGMMGATAGVVWATRGGQAFMAGAALMAVALIPATLSRYEAWLFAVLAVGALGAVGAWRFPEESKRGRWIMGAAFLAAAVLVAGPVLWWLSVQARELGDWRRPLDLTHRFVTDPVGRAEGFRTSVELWRDGLVHLATLPALVVLSLCQRRWTAPRLVLTVPPLVHLGALFLRTAEGGVPWIYGPRVLGFHSMALAFPAALGAWDLVRSAGGWTRVLPVAGVYTGVLAVNLLGTAAPLTSGLDSHRQTNGLIRELRRESPLSSTGRIAVPAANEWDAAYPILLRETQRLLQMPAEWNTALPTAEAFAQWVTDNDVGLVLWPDPLPEALLEAAGTVATRGPEMPAGRLADLQRQGAALAVLTAGKQFDVPGAILSAARGAGLEGPAPAPWVRYAAVIPDEEGRVPPYEAAQAGTNDGHWLIHRTWPRGPIDQRHGLPGTYLLRLDPADDGSTTVAQVGDFVLQPSRPGWYVLAFDPETGSVRDSFALYPPSPYIHRGWALPYFVYRVGGD